MNFLALKLIATVTMLIDHVAYVFGGSLGMIDNNTTFIMRCIGRIALPIYAFMIVNGLVHTRNRDSYKSRLLLFMSLSQIPFVLAFRSISSFSNYPGITSIIESVDMTQLGIAVLILILCHVSGLLVGWKQLGYLALALFFAIQPITFKGIIINDPHSLNVFYTLGAGAILSIYVDDFIVAIKNSKVDPFTILRLITAGLMTYFLCAHSDYGYLGVFLILFLSLLRASKIAQLAILTGWVYQMYSFFPRLLSMSTFALISVLMIASYNGKKGPTNKYIQKFFYYFYPAHLLLLGVAQIFIYFK